MQDKINTVSCLHLFILPLQEYRAYTAVHHNRVWVPHPFRHSERSVGIQPSGAIKSGVGAPPFPSFRA